MILRSSIVRPRRIRRCVDCERLIHRGEVCAYIVAQVDGVGFCYGYEHEACSRKWRRWPGELVDAEAAILAARNEQTRRAM